MFVFFLLTSNNSYFLNILENWHIGFIEREELKYYGHIDSLICLTFISYHSSYLYNSL